MGFSRWERRAGYSGALVVWEGFQAVSSSPERFRGCFGRRAVVPPLPVAVVVPSPADSVGSAPLLRFVPAAFAGCEPWEDSLGGSVWVVVCVEEPASSLVFWLGAMPSAVAGPWVRRVALWARFTALVATERSTPTSVQISRVRALDSRCRLESA
jgi:hypothetical protein